MSSLDPKFVAKLNEIDKQYNPQTQQLQTLHDIADMVQELLSVADSTKSNTDQLQALGAVLDDSRQQLVALNKKEAPETPDYAKPVVDAVQKLSREVTTELAKIDTKPVVNVSPTPVNVAAPNVQVDAPNIDLSKIEKILKSDIPSAFQKAIQQIPQPEQPDDTQQLEKLDEMLDWLKSIDDASRKKPLPGNMGIMSNGAVVSTGNPLPTTAVFSGTIADVNMHDGSGTAITSTGGKLDVNATVALTNDGTFAKETGGNLDTIAAKDFATQTTLALIKAKTDNLDVALSTRTKPADAQHVIVDSGVTTGLTDTQLRATPVPVSGTVTATPTGTQDDNLKQVNGATVNVGTGAAGTGTQRVTTSTDSTIATITNVVHVDDNSGSLTVDNAGTFATQSSQSGTWTVQPGNTANTTAWKVDGSAVTQPISAATLPQATLPSAPKNNQVTVTTAGTRVQLPSNTLTVGVIVQSLSTNGSALIYVGDSSVSSSNGFELQAGQATSVGVTNTNSIWVDASVNGSKICFIGS